MISKNVFIERTNYKTYLISLLLIIFGGLFLSISEMGFIEKYLVIRTLIRDIGSLLIVTVGLSFIWDLFIRRSFFAELLCTSGLAEKIEQTGLISISDKWHGEIDWKKLFHCNDKVLIMFMYGRTWRNTNRQYLVDFARKENSTAKVILPNTTNEKMMELLAKQINTTTTDIIARIKQTEEDFIEIFDIDGLAKNKLEIFEVDTYPVFSYYCFENKAIISLYSHSRLKSEVPSFVVSKGGTLFSFFDKDFNSLIVQGSDVSRKIFPLSE